MSAKDQGNTFNKLKQFFRSNKQAGAAIKERTDFSLTPEFERELRCETPVAQRCKALKELGDVVLTNRLEDSSLMKLWELTKDLIAPLRPAEQRHITLNFYRKLIQGQYESLGLMRAHFFEVIQNHQVAEDCRQRLELLKSLTDNGKDITGFEEEIGKFMLDWKEQIVDASLTDLYLEILVNIIKYNTAYLDKEIVVGIVQHACVSSCTVEDTHTVLLWLSVLDTVICYAIFPNETLHICIIALCRTVNRESYCQTSWKIMKNLLGSNLGHASLYTMCNILNDRRTDDEYVLRGAVFHINMGLWGSSSSVPPTLKCSPSTVLLSFLQALESKHLIVTYEVVLSIQRLIQKCYKEIAEHSWDVICSILSSISENIKLYEQNGLSKENKVQKHFHETLDHIEMMLEKNEIAVEPEVIYNLIEKVSEDRPEISVIKLMEYKTSRITATKPEWLQSLNIFIERFFKMSKTPIRIKAIHSLIQIMDSNRAGYEEEILDRTVLPIFQSIPNEKDIIIRSEVAKMLIDFTLHCDTKRCLELLDIIEKLLNRPFDMFSSESIIFPYENDVRDIIIIIEGLVKIFLSKLYRLPSSHAIRVFHLLIGHLELNYQRPNVIFMSSAIKYQIFTWMLNARANASFHIGYPDVTNKNTIKYSHYLGIDGPFQNQHLTQEKLQTQSGGASAQNESNISSSSFTTISIRRGCKIIVKCLESEKDWYIVQLVLKELPIIMQNKALIQGNDVDSLARALYKMYFDEKMPESYNSSMGGQPSISDFRALILPALASLATYHQYIESHTQKGIVEALKKGLFSTISRQSVQALTVMILEMPETLVKLLPEVLWEMSRISSTVTVAIPILEFLSTLSRLPNQRFANFVATQYLYVFAISMPYTNPDRFDHYTVSLAHHVIAGWFVKCRLPLRRNLVVYIIAGLESNIHRPFQDLRAKTDFTPVNEDSSNRKRSSSLTEQGSRRRERQVLPSLKPLYEFHTELAETCIDFMARHAFSPCSALPKRLPTADFLLAGGQSLTWLVGHNLITITTSGCTSSPFRNGLCDRCLQLCKSNSQAQMKTESSALMTPLSPESSISSKTVDSDSQNKRYTKASLQHSSANESESSDLTSSASSSAAATPYLQQQQGVKFFRQSSTDGRYSSSSGSLETLSRRGSNPDTPENTEKTDSPSKNLSSTLGNTLLLPQMPSSSSTPQLAADRPKPLCACSCTGWAEILIRRPTGNMSWVMRIQNQISDSLTNEFPLHDLTALFTPSLGGGVIENNFFDPIPPKSSENVSNQRSVSIAEHPSEVKLAEDDDQIEIKKIVEKMKESFKKPTVENEPISAAVPPVSASTSSGPIDIPGHSTKRQTSAENINDFEPDEENGDRDDVEFDDGDTSRSRNPVRRVNSSPEMSSNWRNPFLNQKDGNPPGNMSNQNSGLNQGERPSEYSDITNEPAEVQQKQQKKSNFTKDMRVSCEAIPEEIAGSTPPSLTGSVTKDLPPNPTVSEILAPSLLMSSASLPEPAIEEQNTSQITFPKKQLSADDVVPATTTPTTGPITVIGKSETPHPPTNINLKIPIEMPKVTSKPPQSPAPLSPRLFAIKIGNNNTSSLNQQYSRIDNKGNGGDNNNDLPRVRSKTISSVPMRETFGRDNLKWSRNSKAHTGISPSFVFLQLYHTGQLNVAERPVLVDDSCLKTIQVLDLIPPFETHNIGVLYVGPGQCNNETEILKNRFGSLRYAEFLRNLGTLVAIKDAKEHNLFINMDCNGEDGNFTYIWQDDIVQVTFHVATLMPNKENDPKCNEKKKNIGNDYVTIVYNESGEDDYNLNTIKGQFNYACVIVQPLELNSNRVYVLAKDQISDYVKHSEPKMVSDNSAPLLARQLALHANLAARVSVSLNTKNQSPYASNWLERLRKIKHIRAKLGAVPSAMNDPSGSGSQKGGNRDTSSKSGGDSGMSGQSGSGGQKSGNRDASSSGGGSGSSNDLPSKRAFMNDFTLYT